MIWISLAYAADVTLSPGDDVATLTAALQPGDVVNFEPGTTEICRFTKEKLEITEAFFQRIE